MSIKKIPLEELPTFGRKLAALAREENLGDPFSLAKELYKKYPDLVTPVPRKNKGTKIPQDRAIEDIRRKVQNHFNEEYAYNIPSKFLYAYSKLFNCSLDYFFDTTEIRSRDLEIREICNKLHLEEQAVLNLIDNYDPDPETFSPTEYWSKMLSSDMFCKVPYAWNGYSLTVLQYEDLEKKINAISNAESYTNDLDYKEIMMEPRRDALEKMRYQFAGFCEGSYQELMEILSSYINSTTKEWVSSQHVDYEENYYDNEIEEIKQVEKFLKEGSEPVHK